MIGYRKGYQLEQLADLTLPSVIVNEKVTMTPGVGDGQTAVFSFSGEGEPSDVVPISLCNSNGQTEDGYGMKSTQLKYGTDYQVMINGELVDREKFQIDTTRAVVTFKNVPYKKSGTSKQQPPKQTPRAVPFNSISKLKPEVPVYDEESLILNDPTANFKRNGVIPGIQIQNLTTGVTGKIVASASGDSEIANWTRTVTTITVTQTNHEYVVGETLTIVQSSSLLAIPLGTVNVISVIDVNNYTFACEDAGDASGYLAVAIPSNEVEGTKLFSDNPGLLWQDKDRYQVVSSEFSPAQVIEGEITETFPYLYDDAVDFLSDESETEGTGYIWAQKVRIGDTLVKNPGPDQVEGSIVNVTNHTVEAVGLAWQAGDTYKIYRTDKDATLKEEWPQFTKIFPKCPLQDTNNPDATMLAYNSSVVKNVHHWTESPKGWLWTVETWVGTEYDFTSETWGRDRSWSGQIDWYRFTASASGSTGRIYPGMVFKIGSNSAIITRVTSNQLDLSNSIRLVFPIPFAVSAKVNLGKKNQVGILGVAKDPTPGVESETDSVKLFNGKVNFNNVEFSPGVFGPVTPGMYIENLTNPQDGLINFVGPYIEATNSTTEITKSKLSTYDSAVQGIQGAVTAGGQNILPNIQEQLELAAIPPVYTVPATSTPPFMSATPYVTTTNAVGTISILNTNPTLYLYFTKLKLDMYKNLGLDKLNKMLWRNGDKYRITKQAEKNTIKFKLEGTHTAPQVFSPENFLQDNDINFLIRGVRVGMKIIKTNTTGNTDGIITLAEQHRIQAVSLDNPSKFVYWDVGDSYSISGEMAIIDPEKPMTQLYDSFTDFTQELKPYLEKRETLYLKNVRTGHQGRITKVEKNIIEAIDGYGSGLDDGYGYLAYPDKGPLLWYDGYGEEPYEIFGLSNTNAPKNGDVMTCSYCNRDMVALDNVQKSRNSILTYSTSILPTQRRLGRSFTSS